MSPLPLGLWWLLVGLVAGWWALKTARTRQVQVAPLTEDESTETFAAVRPTTTRPAAGPAAEPAAEPAAKPAAESTAEPIDD